MANSRSRSWGLATAVSVLSALWSTWSFASTAGREKAVATNVLPPRSFPRSTDGTIEVGIISGIPLIAENDMNVEFAAGVILGVGLASTCYLLATGDVVNLLKQQPQTRDFVGMSESAAGVLTLYGKVALKGYNWGAQQMKSEVPASKPIVS